MPTYLEMKPELREWMKVYPGVSDRIMWSEEQKGLKKFTHISPVVAGQFISSPDVANTNKRGTDRKQILSVEPNFINQCWKLVELCTNLIEGWQDKSKEIKVMRGGGASQKGATYDGER